MFGNWLVEKVAVVCNSAGGLGDQKNLHFKISKNPLKTRFFAYFFLQDPVINCSNNELSNGKSEMKDATLKNCSHIATVGVNTTCKKNFKT